MSECSSIIWRRLRYMLTPQFDLYKRLAERLPVIYNSREGRYLHSDTFSLLDYGCGTGFGTLQFKSALEDETVIGVDSDSEVVAFASDILGKVAEFVHADALAATGSILRSSWGSLVDKDAPFGVALLIEVIEHLGMDEQQDLVGEITRVLDGERGILVLSTPNKHSQFRKHSGHLGMHDPASLRALLSPHFASVSFEDYLGEPIADDSTVSPLVAICREPK